MARERASVGNLGWTLRAAAKRVLGATRLPPLLSLEKIYWGLRFNSWLKRKGCAAVPHLRGRFELYAYLNRSVLKEGAIDYLEFGVAGGDSIREWMRLNRHPDSRFVGFDTFKGLPEEWKHVGGSTPGGTFSAHGQPPVVDNEPRVTFVSGLFQDTLPGFLRAFQPSNQLVVHLDADLHSSTLYVLAVMYGALRPGTIVLFDEFNSFDNEFRALEEFASAFRKEYCLLACGGGYYERVAIRIER